MIFVLQIEREIKLRTVTPIGLYKRGLLITLRAESMAKPDGQRKMKNIAQAYKDKTVDRKTAKFGPQQPGTVLKPPPGYLDESEMIDPSEFQALLTRKGAPDKYRSSVEGLANCASPTSDMIYNGEYYLLPGGQNVVSIIEYDLFFCNRNGYVSIMFIL